MTFPLLFPYNKNVWAYARRIFFEMESNVKNKIFHTQDLCLRTNLRCAKNSAGIEIIKEVITAFLVENSMYKSHNTSHILQIREKQTVQGRCDRKIAFIYERGS